MPDEKSPNAIIEIPEVDERKIPNERSPLPPCKPMLCIEERESLAARIAPNPELGFAKCSIPPACRAVLIVLSWLTAPCELAYAVNDLPDSSHPKFVQTVYPHWWSPTAPDGEEFELPSGTKTCSVLKVRFVGEITWVAARVGPTYPWGVSFLVEDNFGDQQYRTGKVIGSRFYHGYNDIHFFQSELNRRLGAQSVWFQDRNDAKLVLQLALGKDQPETPVTHVCVFKEGEQVSLSYFLRRSPPVPWRYDFR